MLDLRQLDEKDPIDFPLDNKEIEWSKTVRDAIIYRTLLTHSYRADWTVLSEDYGLISKSLELSGLRSYKTELSKCLIYTPSSMSTLITDDIAASET